MLTPAPLNERQFCDFPSLGCIHVVTTTSCVSPVCPVPLSECISQRARSRTRRPRPPTFTTAPTSSTSTATMMPYPLPSPCLVSGCSSAEAPDLAGFAPRTTIAGCAPMGRLPSSISPPPPSGLSRSLLTAPCPRAPSEPHVEVIPGEKSTWGISGPGMVPGGKGVSLVEGKVTSWKRSWRYRLALIGS